MPSALTSAKPLSRKHLERTRGGWNFLDFVALANFWVWCSERLRHSRTKTKARRRFETILKSVHPFSLLSKVTKLQSAARGRAARQSVALLKSRSQLDAEAASTDEGTPPEAPLEQDPFEEVSPALRDAVPGLCKVAFSTQK